MSGDRTSIVDGEDKAKKTGFQVSKAFYRHITIH